MTMRIQTISSKPDIAFNASAILRLCVCVLTLWAGLTLCATDVAADSIVYKGVLYEDVLIYKGSNSYYVKLPQEGRVFNVPSQEVNPSQVHMVHDPYYRDELKLRFEDAKKRLQSGQKLPKRKSGNSLSLADSQAEEFSASDLLDRSGGNSGLGVSRDSIQAALTAAGMTITETAGGVVTLKAASGNTTIKLYGSPDSLTKIVLQGRVLEKKRPQLQTNLTQAQTMLSAFAPWTGPWIQSNMSLFATGGTAEETQDGKRIRLTITLASRRVKVELTFEGV